MTPSSTLTNLREVGGAGFQTGHRRTVFRSNTEPGLSASVYPPDVTVVDLRRDDEVRQVPHPLADSTSYRAVPLFDPSSPVESAADAVELEDQYIDWLERHRSGIAAALRVVAATEGDVLVCCSAGKDRTGIVSALLARHWGAGDARIGDDYAASATGLAARFAAERSTSADPLATARAQRCVPEIMTTVVAHVERRWGSVEEYLRWTGLTAGEIDAL